MPLIDWVGITVDIFAQFTQALVALFKITTLQEHGWDLAEVRRRADVFSILDSSSDSVNRVPAALGMVDAEGPRSGLFFKTSYLLRAIKTLFLTEMPQALRPDSLQSQIGAGDGSNLHGDAEDAQPSDRFLCNLVHEPWLPDILDFLYNQGLHDPADTASEI